VWPRSPTSIQARQVRGVSQCTFADLASFDRVGVVTGSPW
jgi:hypothetical protein